MQTPIHAVTVVCHEGERARPALAALRKTAHRLTVLQDGPADAATDGLSREFADEVIVYPRKGCKEPHLASFFARPPEKFEWFMHLDSDEIVSDELAREVGALDLSQPAVYSIDLAHTLKDGVVLRYKQGSPRTRKPLLFHVSRLNSVIGLPHGALELAGPWKHLRHSVEHRAVHLNYSFRQLAAKEARFARTDAALRVKPVLTLSSKGLVELSPCSRKLGLANWLRNSHPIAAMPLSFGYQLIQALRWLLDVRSMPALRDELLMMPIRPSYQAYLCYLVWRGGATTGGKGK